MRCAPDSNDEEIEIRVRLPEQDRVLSTLDALKVRTPDGLVPLSNFVSRKPVAKLAEINRVDQQRYYDVKADVEPGLSKVTMEGPDGELVRLAVTREVAEGCHAIRYGVGQRGRQIIRAGSTDPGLRLSISCRDAIENGDAKFALINPNERDRGSDRMA